ncbi:MAG: glucose-6-phosphate dehydrogenase [Gemmatimonadaceae bacterium]
MTEALSIPLEVPEQAAGTKPQMERGTPCTMVILGASGDLARRKLVPALFHLMGDGLLSKNFSVIGIGREKMSDDQFRDAIHSALEGPRTIDSQDPGDWNRFARRLEYIGGDLADAATFGRLRERLSAVEASNATGEGVEQGSVRGRLFYLALPPGAYETALVHLSESGLAPRRESDEDGPWVRIIIEKPFGNDLESADILNRVIHMRFAEHQIFRIDHYLGKETVQNLLVFRFANSIFEPVWNRDHVHHVQITAAESVGIEHRAGYYEHAGVFRDMFQNHLLQLLALTAMEPPVTFQADAVRSEKVKVMAAIRPIPGGEMHRNLVAGQYGPGRIGGRPVSGYREEEEVASNSGTPTYGALRLLIDNWRWQGVPFFLRSGKRMPRRATEIAIRFRQPPHLMFPLSGGKQIAPNVLAFRIQPDEGISLCFEVKVPDHDFRMATASMNFTYAGGFGASSHTAYETLLVDCMLGDATLFTRSDGVEAAWRVMDPIIAAVEQPPLARVAGYSAGDWGPAEADALIAGDGAEWRTP